MKRLLTAVLAAVATAVALGSAAPAAAAPATGWYMLVNDSYNWCLSTNEQTSPSGSGTHRVYLAACNPKTAGQWWRLSGNSTSSSLTNYQNFGSGVWSLSNNASTPSGGGAGTYGVYTSLKSNTQGQEWSVIDDVAEHKVRFASWLSGKIMSATHNSPFSGGTYRVYTATGGVNPPPAHLWRFWAHPSGRPSCSTPCGDY
ncbi:hypothetical protein [Actinoplanes sp. M2I2]|uniref:hypothetical protein n=1 Tax=Actinoplanes sp. M2I2 TaxID=1734444 RepID=UPI00202044C9|nr:hypothetical protein [Actinoplanes sp. M2I2]